MFSEAIRRLERLGASTDISSSDVPIYDEYGHLIPWDNAYTSIIQQVTDARDFPYCMLKRDGDIVVLTVSRNETVWQSELLEVRERAYLATGTVFRGSIHMYSGTACISTQCGVQWLSYSEYMARLCMKQPFYHCWTAKLLKDTLSAYRGLSHLSDDDKVYSTAKSIPSAVKSESLYVFNGVDYTKLHLTGKDDSSKHE